VIPMSDTEWHELLEEVGLVPRPRPPTAWSWCSTCQRTMPLDRVEWWHGRTVARNRNSENGTWGYPEHAEGRGVSSRVRFVPPVAQLARPFGLPDRIGSG
jgi:hypothetical protein